MKTIPVFKKLLDKAKDGLKKPWLGTGWSQADIQRVDEIARDELNSAFVLAQQIAPILAEGTKGNPRQIKRFLNALLVRQVIAKARGFGDQIKQPVLAKLMLAERFQPDFYEHISMQAMGANDGKVSDLAFLETSGHSEKPKKKAKSTGEKSGKKEEEIAQPNEMTNWLERDWLKQWLQLEPKLKSEDLRPYVFVARDKRQLTGDSIQGSLETLISKLCGTQIEIRLAEQEVKELSSVDAGIVFTGLRERVLSVDSFKTAPEGIDGLAIVAKHHPYFQVELVALLETFDPKELGLWVVKGWNESITDALAHRKLLEVMRGWEEQDDNTMLKSAAQSAIKTIQPRER